MHIQLPKPVQNIVKASNFWQDNYLILREFKHFRNITILAVIFSVFSASFEGVTIGFLLSFLDTLTNPNIALDKNGFIGKIVTFILGENASKATSIYIISILILLSTWMRAGFNYFAQIYTELSQLHLADRLRKRIFEQLQSLTLSYFAETRSGSLINTVTTEIERIKQAFGAASFVFTKSLTIIVYFLILFLIEWRLTIISLLAFTLLAVGLSTLNKRVREASFGITNANDKLNSTLLEFINGIRTVQAFGTQDLERERFYKSSANVVQASQKTIAAWAVVRPLAEGFGTTVLISLIITSFTTFTLEAAPLLTFFFVLVRAVPGLQDINGTVAFISTLKGSAENIQEVLRTDNKEYFQDGETYFPGLRHSIDLRSVDFGYKGNELVLHDITLSFERGKTTALVGGTGAGKSTLADLIPRFHEPTEGKILIDGSDLLSFQIDSLRQKIAVVSQNTFIFNTSVRDNIAYGTSGATEEQIRFAAVQANALEFIEEMPQDFDTKLGDWGVRLSGGQRQRIAIARALLRDPQILILDEATSALDSVTEKLIQQSIEKLSVGRTVIAIAHRLSTIAKADKVVVLEKGRIVEQGKYQDLLEQRGALWKYHQTQYESSAER
jgi:ATP-binding cassette, subfamily B, bacterial MsbA